MHDHELHAAVVIGRRMAGVVTRGAGTTGQNEQRREEGKNFMAEDSTRKTVMQQCNVLPCVSTADELI